MNVQEYISSGIVESYVLGLADGAERAEFERMCAEYPEVLAARDAFELSLEASLMEDAVTPPQSLKSAILARLENEEKNAPIVPLSAAADASARAQGIHSAPQTNRFRYLAAASVILLLASTALNFYFFRQYQDYSTRYNDLLASQQQLASSNTTLQARLSSLESAMAIMRDPQMTVVPMPGVPTSPDPSSLATVYWNNLTKDVYLLVNNMPQPATDRQYQLWALVDGKPVDAGVFDTAPDAALVKMKNIPRAQAFAITLEKRGGSASPTMDQMYVLGNVRS